jgi:type I restriction enzyme S subunit
LVQSAIFHPLRQNNAIISNSKYPKSKPVYFDQSASSIPGAIHSIATFLDRETAIIDALVAEQQRLIELLKEKRQAVISHAVTKGLNPNAPMKDSGVEWLGEVPEEWDVINLNYVLDAIGDVDHFMPESIEKGIPYVMTGDLKEFASNIKFEDCKQVSHKDYLKLSKKIRSSRGDVIMARYATIGTTSYIDVDADFLVSYSCVTIKPNHSKVIGLYLFYYFKSDAFLQGIQNQINTNTQGNVGVNDLKNVKVALPTLTEQTRIIEYLQSKISKLDCISDRSQATIELLKERRTALISAAVTGKIDVRDLVSDKLAIEYSA